MHSIDADAWRDVNENQDRQKIREKLAQRRRRQRLKMTEGAMEGSTTAQKDRYIPSLQEIAEKRMLAEKNESITVWSEKQSISEKNASQREQMNWMSADSAQSPSYQPIQSKKSERTILDAEENVADKMDWQPEKSVLWPVAEADPDHITDSLDYHNTAISPVVSSIGVSIAIAPHIAIAEGTDLEIGNKELLPYGNVGVLGHGASASVEMVRDQVTGEVYARKLFRNVYARNLEDAKTHFRNEVRVMRRLSTHHHIIKLHATYLAGRELALILNPVADGGDLATFMQEFRDLRDTGTTMLRLSRMERILDESLGCLASGLAFIHKKTIRHKDIKPQNILIHQGQVLYTDFGLSLDHSDLGHSTTTGRPDGFTRRYCAPEVANHGNRNSKSDVFSLGCVFTEIIATFYPSRVPEKFLEGPFYQTVVTEGASFRKLLRTRHQGPQFAPMLAWEPEDRPTAAGVIKIIEEAWDGRGLYFCSRCRRSRIETSEGFVEGTRKQREDAP